MIQKRLLPLVLSMLLLLPLTGGCSKGRTASQEAWRTNSNTAVFSLRDISGSTGYTWQYEITNPDVLRYVKDEVAAPGKTPGASGIIAFTFEGVQEGGTTLLFTQVPPGAVSGESSDGDRLRYEITVDANGNVSVG